MNKQNFKIINFFILFLFLSINISCQKEGTSTGNGLVSINFNSFTPFQQKVSIQSLTELKLCFKRLRFKKADEPETSDFEGDSSNIDLNIGEVSLNVNGFSLTEVSIPKDTYTRLEFDLEKNCADSISANSVNFTNAAQSFFTDERVTIKFSGTFTLDEAQENIAVSIDSIVTALSTVTNNGDIKPNLEAASGSFTE